MKRFHFIFPALCILILSSCHSDKANGDESSFKSYPRVREIKVTYGPISNHVDVNATAAYLRTSLISSPIDGYILRSFIEPHQSVKPGRILYILQTKESRALRSGDHEMLDRFTGNDTIVAHSGGYVTETFHQQGDYVSNGEKLLTVKETSSLVFVLHLPYEWNDLVRSGMKVRLIFPDSTFHTATVRQINPEMDPATQTQKVILTINNAQNVPEGLIARAEITKKSSDHSTLLPQDAVLTNETETEYWVMKMINDSIAVRVPVTTGIISHDTVQILQPSFTKDDRILVYGNYSVPDTMQVIVTDSAR